MSKKTYIGINNKPCEVKCIYIGISGIVKRVKQAFVGGKDGKPKLAFCDHKYNYNNATYTWSNDFSSCMATIPCANCSAVSYETTYQIVEETNSRNCNEYDYKATFSNINIGDVWYSGAGWLTRDYDAHSWTNGSCTVCGVTCTQHSDSNGDNICDTCGENLQAPHEHTWVIDSGDAQGHYYVCSCGADKFEYEDHSWTDGKCTIQGCNYECKHPEENISDWQYTTGESGQHWRNCECGKQLNLGTHEPICEDYDDTYHVYRCEVCNKQVASAKHADASEEKSYIWHTTNIHEIICTCGKSLGEEGHIDVTYDSSICAYRCNQCNGQSGNTIHDWSNKDGICVNNSSHTCEHPEERRIPVEEASTCGSEGRTGYICGICGDESNVSIVPATGKHTPDEMGMCAICGTCIEHKWGSAQKAGALGHYQVCENCGARSPEDETTYDSHDWSNDDGLCSDCGYPCEHPNGFTTTGRCKVCNARCQHLDSAGISTLKYTQLDESRHSYECTKCGLTGEEGHGDAVPDDNNSCVFICSQCRGVVKVEHSWVETSAKAATCTTPGISYQDCACGAQQEVEIPADHKYTYSNYDGSTHIVGCSACDHHDLEDHTPAAVSGNEHHTTCSKCGALYIVAEGHEEIYTELGDGSYKITCKSCDYEESGSVG